LSRNASAQVALGQAIVLIGRQYGLDLAARGGIVLLQEFVGDQRDRAMRLRAPGMGLPQRQKQRGTCRADTGNNTQ